MAKFGRKNKGGLPAINTSSMPDVIFMMLFFFMTVTSLRETTLLVDIKMPKATEIEKLERKDLTSYIYIGTPTKEQQALKGTDAQIQLNDSFSNVNDIRDFVISERDKLSEVDRQQMTISLKIDQDVRMGIVGDVKQELRRSSALKIHYAATKAD